MQVASPTTTTRALQIKKTPKKGSLPRLLLCIFNSAVARLNLLGGGAKIQFFKEV